MVLLPGGAGSLDELFEALTWRQLGLHAKPIVILNTEGYWTPLKALIAHVIDQGFADSTLAEFVTWAETPEQAIAALGAHFRGESRAGSAQAVDRAGAVPGSSDR